ncbi:MAG: ATP-binding cassette domain-containing protein [Candidatus Hydrogenedentes bacterium]|nr:ATP-binding cassette domain-containing protein [Candidatus Hydrogenedentota bacterium]
MDIPFLSLENVGVSVAGVSLLEGIRISVGRGEIVGVFGPSGCGKSALLRCVAGLCDPASGEIRFRDGPAGEHGWPEYRREVVLVGQQPALLEASVEENLARVFSYRVSNRAFPRDEARELLERLEVGAHRLAQPARSLSVGQQQRVCLVRALLIRPAVLLLDEPASALDARAAALVEDVLRRSVDEGRCEGILLVTHDRDQIERLCDASLDLSPHRVGAGAAG